MLKLQPFCLVAMAGTIVSFFAGSLVNAADSRYLPNDTAVIVTINWRQILDADLVRGQKDAVDQFAALVDQFGEIGTIRRRLGEAGIDLLRDLERITYAAGKDSRSGVLIMEGKFDAARLDAATVCDWGASDKKVYASLVNNRTLVAAGTKMAVTEALGRLRGSARPAPEKSFAALLETTDSKQSASFVASGAALSRLMGDAAVAKADIAAATLKSLDALAGSITIGKGVDFQVGIYAKNEDTAKKLAAAGNSTLLAIRTSLQQRASEDPKLRCVLEIVNTVRITGHRPNIVIRGSASLDTIENLMKRLPVTP